MVFETLKMVKGAEKDSLSKVEHAGQDAEEMEMKANKTADQLVNDTIEEANAEVETLIENALSQAKRSADEIITGGGQETRRLIAQAQPKVEDAGKFIVSQIAG